MRRRALLTPLELCITALKELMRRPLERYGEMMFDRGVRYERERLERLVGTLPPPKPNPAITEVREYDFERTTVGRPHGRRHTDRDRDDTTPTRPVRPLDLKALKDLDRDPAEEKVVPPTKRDPRAK